MRSSRAPACAARRGNGQEWTLQLRIRLVVLACLLALAWGRPAGDSVSAAPAQVGALPTQADVLLAQPRGMLSVLQLEQALSVIGFEVLPRSDLLAVARVAVPPGGSAVETAQRLAATGLVASIEADVRVRANRIPDDPLYPQQAPYLDVIRAPQAWDAPAGGGDVVIAVVDTGLDLTHPDLRGRGWTNPGELPADGVDNDDNGCVDDVHGCAFVSLQAADPSCDYTAPAPNERIADDDGHGTFVAGIAAARGDDATGITGVAPGGDIRLLAVKVLDCTETGRISDAAAGIRYAARSGAQIIVIAFGSTTDSRVLREATAEAVDRGALVVASTGNDGTDGRIHFPAGYPGVLAVAGTGYTGTDGVTDYRRLASFSNLSPAVRLLAPAVGILGPLPPALCGEHGWRCLEGQPYARSAGTSFAAPLVAGAAALLYSRHPDLTAAFATALLTASAAPLPRLDAGQLDVAGALARPLFEAGLPGTSRTDGRPPSGPAEHTAVPPPGTPTPPTVPLAPPALPTPPPRLTPVPPSTGGGPG